MAIPILRVAIIIPPSQSQQPLIHSIYSALSPFGETTKKKRKRVLSCSSSELNPVIK